MQKTKKYFPLIVGLVVLLSVAAYGTRAYFSDSTGEQAGIELTLGDIDVTTEHGLWMYDTETSEQNANLEEGGNPVKGKELNGSEVKLTHARPGDTFSKVFTFKNTGSLDQVLTFSPSNNNSNSIFKITWDTTKLDNNNALVAVTESVDVKMYVSVIKNEYPEALNEEKSANKKETNSFNTLVKENVTVTAVQTNAPKN